MTKRILFIQGGGNGVRDPWDNALVASLTAKLGASYEITYPRLPESSIVVRHSIGAAILVNAHARIPLRKKLAGIFLLAMPFIGAGGWPSDNLSEAFAAILELEGT